MHSSSKNSGLYFQPKLGNMKIMFNTDKRLIIPLDEISKSKRYRREREREREREILCPRDWLFPVKRKVTGQDPELLQDSSGKSVNGTKSVLTARYSGDGICNRGGNPGGSGIGQVAA